MMKKFITGLLIVLSFAARGQTSVALGNLTTYSGDISSGYVIATIPSGGGFISRKIPANLIGKTRIDSIANALSGKASASALSSYLTSSTAATTYQPLS